MANYSIFGETQNYRNENSVVKLDETKTVEFHYTGSYASLEQTMPKKDTAWSEAGSMWTVLNSRLVREPAGMGEMIVCCIPYQSGGAEKEGEAKIQIEYVETSQPLAFHKDFPGSKDDELMKKWQKFVASPSGIQLDLKFATDPSDDSSGSEDLPTELVKWAKLYNKGLEEFLVYLPVVTRTQAYKQNPKDEVSDVGKIDEPPVVPAGFADGDWLKTCDTDTIEPGSGKWTRVEAWTYAHEWPELLYGRSS